MGWTSLPPPHSGRWSGPGIEADVEGNNVLIVAANTFPADGLSQPVRALEQAGQTVVMVVQNGVAIGMLALRDTLRDDAKTPSPRCINWACRGDPHRG